MTMLAAGHDTTSSTIAFLLYELARNPEALDRVVAEADAELDGGAPDLGRLGDGLPELGMAVDETLRLYPPAWFGPRRAFEDLEFGGHTIPRDTHLAYSSWVSHRLAGVFADPEQFLPERFSPEARAALPRGAYVPFGGGSRICIGKRFGLLVVKVAATLLLQRARPRLLPGHRLEIATVPNLSPKGGLPMVLEPS
jgi:cytochrome P450